MSDLDKSGDPLPTSKYQDHTRNVKLKSYVFRINIQIDYSKNLRCGMVTVFQSDTSKAKDGEELSNHGHGKQFYKVIERNKMRGIQVRESRIYLQVNARSKKRFF